MTAITAITVQNTKGVYGYEAMSPQLVDEQIRAVTTDIGVDAAKTGMLANAGIVRAVAAVVAELAIPHLVVDPVFVSKHGHRLLAEDAVVELRSRILPLATLVTPNLPEASGLADVAVEAKDDMRRAADAILALGAGAVLVKGGHLEASTEAADLFVSGGTEEWLVERADRHAEHPRDRMHAVVGDHGAPGDGVGAAGRGARGEGVRDRGDPRGAGDRRRDRARGSAVVVAARGSPVGGRYEARWGMRVTLPALMHDVQTCRRRGVPSTRARTFWMFGSQRRLFRLWEKVTALPKNGFFPQTSHTAAIGRPG